MNDADRRTTRVLDIEGGRNFRDMGGYATASGRKVRWGRLYRSGVMAHLSDEAASHVIDLGVRVVCDLRSSREREREAVRWLPPGVEYLHWDYDGARVSFAGLVGRGEIDARGTREAMLRLYRALPAQFELPYAALFARIAQGEVPLIFNCSAGKDRTGVGAALVLTALEVPWETVLEDFALTDQVVDLEQIYATQQTSLGLQERVGRIASLPPDVRAPLMSADPAYLQASFDAIRAEHGSVLHYLESRLGVTPGELERIRAQLLE